MSQKINLVSVCIPTYNGEKYLKETITSVLNSTHKRIEIIIADDLSNDHTLEVIEGAHNGLVKSIHNKRHLGVPANWNNVLRNAHGDLVCFLNHDDLIGPFWLSYALKIFNTYPEIGWMASAFYLIDHNGSPQKIVKKFSENRIYTSLETFPLLIRLNGLGPGFIIKRDELFKLNLFDEDLGPSADNELFLRLSANFLMFYSTTPHVSWRIHADNLTHKWNPIQQTREGIKTLKKTFSNVNLHPELKKYENDAMNIFKNKTRTLANSLTQHGNRNTAAEMLKILEKY